MAHLRQPSKGTKTTRVARECLVISLMEMPRLRCEGGVLFVAVCLFKEVLVEYF